MGTAPATDSPEKAKDGRRFGRRVVRFTPMLIVAAAVAYLSLRSSPAPSSVPGLPRGIGQFFNRHDFSNNVIGFGALAATVHLAFADHGETWRPIAVRAAAVLVSAIALEIAQHWLPLRSSDWRDVVAAFIGIVIASLPWLFFARTSATHAQ